MAIDYTFREVGAEYPSGGKPSGGYAVRDYLDSVHRAESFIERNRHDLADGVHWEGAESDAKDVTWYDGTAGILYYYLTAYVNTGDSRYLQSVRESARYLAHHWRDLLEEPPATFTPDLASGYYHGVGGVGALLIEAYKVLGDKGIAQTTREIADWYVHDVRHDDLGAYWNGVPASISDGGVILYLIEQAETIGDDDGSLRRLVIDAGERLLGYGEDTGDGGLKFNALRGRRDIYQPSFEFGTAGAGYILAALYEFTDDSRYLEAAKRAGVHLRSLFVEQPGGGALVPWGFDANGDPVLGEDGKTLLYAGVCLGAAGIEKYYYKLYAVTGERHYLDDARSLAQGLISSGAPLRQTNGLWNSVCYCCGHAGIVHVFAGLYAATRDELYKRIALEAADVLVAWGEPLSGDAEDWPIAYNRVDPHTITRKIGYWDGAAGIAAALRQASYLRGDEGIILRLRDDPFPRTISQNRHHINDDKEKP